MQKITFLVSILFLAFSSCGVKTTQSMLSDGNYDGAIDRAVEALRTKKDSKENKIMFICWKRLLQKPKIAICVIWRC